MPEAGPRVFIWDNPFILPESPADSHSTGLLGHIENTGGKIGVTARVSLYNTLRCQNGQAYRGFLWPELLPVILALCTKRRYPK